MTPTQLSAVVHELLSRTLEAIEAQHWERAQQTCHHILQLDAHNAEAHHLLGYVLGRLGFEGEAIASLERAVALDPCHSQYRYNLAVSLGQAGRESEAALQYRACLRQQPGHRDALWNYGEMLRMAEHFDLAAELFSRFEALGGDYPALHHRLGVCLSALGDDQAASQRFERELARPGHDVLTCWELALHDLSNERFAQGFSNYRRRFEAGGRNSVYCHDFGLPIWQGQLQRGQTLLIHGEQGLGDEMMFASILPELLEDARAVQARIILAVKPPLVRLFAQSFPQAQVYAHKVGERVLELQGLGPVDFQLPIGDLAYFYRREEGDFAAGRKPYLHADSSRTAWYHGLLQAMEPPGAAAPILRVGIMWGSNPAPVSNRFARWSQQRSVPVAMFEVLAKHLPQVRFVSLQNQERGAEAALAPRLDILDLSSLQTDFAETAALVNALDLIISVDTSVSHLAGGMGKPCWVPLMKRADWRHGRTRDTSLWYEGTRYFRQTSDGDWSAVLARIDQAMAELLRCVPAQTDALRQALELLRQRDLPASRRYFEEALSQDPDNPALQWEFSMELLTEGDWSRGWDYHEARLSVFGWEALNLCPLPWPIWQGQSLENKTIVVHGEQGIGDEIMYCSMIPDLLSRGAKVVLACVPPLVELMRDSFAQITVVSHPRGAPQAWKQQLPAWVEHIGDVDYQVPMGSMARMLRRDSQAFSGEPYLRANPERISSLGLQLAQRLRGDCEGMLRIGVAWCGNLNNPNGQAKSLRPEQLLPIAQIPGVRLVGLQSREHAGDAHKVPGLHLIDMSEFTDDFANLAALASQLDLVISIDSSYVHLCGAMGIPTWLVLRRNCDWRWGWGRTDTVWYRSVRLFQQKDDGDWAPVIMALCDALTQRAVSPEIRKQT